MADSWTRACFSTAWWVCQVIISSPSSPSITRSVFNHCPSFPLHTSLCCQWRQSFSSVHLDNVAVTCTGSPQYLGFYFEKEEFWFCKLVIVLNVPLRFWSNWFQRRRTKWIVNNLYSNIWPTASQHNYKKGCHMLASGWRNKRFMGGKKSSAMWKAVKEKRNIFS